MAVNTHKKIRKNKKILVTKLKQGGKKFVAHTTKDTIGNILMASETVGTKASNSLWIEYIGGASHKNSMSFIVDTTNNPSNSSDKTIIVPFTLYTPSYAMTIYWGDGNSTSYAAGTALTTASLTHTYSTAGIYTITVESVAEKSPVLNWSTSGDTNGNKYKLVQLSTPLLAFDSSCPNASTIAHFADGCTNLTTISYGLFMNNPQIKIYDYAFNECTSLTHIPADLFKYAAYQSSYQYVLANNPNLIKVPEDLFNNVDPTDLSGAFSGDTGLSNHIDIDTFFGTTPYINVDVHDMFNGCSNTTGDAVEFIQKFTQYVAYISGNGTFDTGYGTLTGKIYAQPVYDSGELVRDLVPAKTGNIYGGKFAPQDCLWDELQQEFLLPTSTFTYGVEVDSELENNLADPFKKDALAGCTKWTNFAIPETVWTGNPASKEFWLSTDSQVSHWTCVDPQNTLLFRYINSRVDAIDFSGNIIQSFPRRNLQYIEKGQQTLDVFALAPNEVYKIDYETVESVDHPIIVQLANEENVVTTNGSGLVREDGTAAIYVYHANYEVYADTANMTGAPIISRVVSSNTYSPLAIGSDNVIYKITGRRSIATYGFTDVQWSKVCGPASAGSQLFTLATDTSNNLYVADVSGSSTRTPIYIPLNISVNSSSVLPQKYMTKSTSNLYYQNIPFINNGVLNYVVLNTAGTSATTGVIDDTHTWVDCVSDGSTGLFLTNDGAIYTMSAGNGKWNLNRYGTSNGWTKLGGGEGKYTALCDGNVYIFYIMSATSISVTQLTTSGDYVDVYGGFGISSSHSARQAILAYAE